MNVNERNHRTVAPFRAAGTTLVFTFLCVAQNCSGLCNYFFLAGANSYIKTWSDVPWGLWCLPWHPGWGKSETKSWLLGMKVSCSPALRLQKSVEIPSLGQEFNAERRLYTCRQSQSISSASSYTARPLVLRLYQQRHVHIRILLLLYPKAPRINCLPYF